MPSSARATLQVGRAGQPAARARDLRTPSSWTSSCRVGQGDFHASPERGSGASRCPVRSTTSHVANCGHLAASGPGAQRRAREERVAGGATYASRNVRDVGPLDPSPADATLPVGSYGPLFGSSMLRQCSRIAGSAVRRHESGVDCRATWSRAARPARPITFGALSAFRILLRAVMSRASWVLPDGQTEILRGPLLAEHQAQVHREGPRSTSAAKPVVVGGFRIDPQRQRSSYPSR